MDNSKFTWTQEFRRSWEENTKTISKIIPTYSKPFSTNRKNIIRHLLVCIDTSSAIEKSDYVPTIRNTLSNCIPNFVLQFKNSNPLSIISFLTCKNTFDKFSREFDSGSLLNSVGNGDFSFLNCLKSAIELIKTSTYNKEVLIITSSIGTKDQGVYEQIFSDIKKLNIKINIISICGEVSIFKKVAELSNGLFLVPIDQFHFEILLSQFTEPMECLERTSCLVKLGFPKITNNSSLCICHLKFENNLYECPVCKAFICKLPFECPVCNTQLVSPLDISKSFYFMYPLKPFILNEDGNCKKCGKKAKSACSECNSHFCEECDRKLHEELGFCIFCNT